MQTCMFTCGLHIRHSVHSFKPFRGHLHEVPKLPIILTIYIFTDFIIIFLTINPNPHCQLSLWEETGEPGQNPRLSPGCWQTLPTCDQMVDTGLEAMTSVVGGRRVDDLCLLLELYRKMFLSLRRESDPHYSDLRWDARNIEHALITIFRIQDICDIVIWACSIFLEH